MRCEPGEGPTSVLRGCVGVVAGCQQEEQEEAADPPTGPPHPLRDVPAGPNTENKSPILQYCPRSDSYVRSGRICLWRHSAVRPLGAWGAAPLHTATPQLAHPKPSGRQIKSEK